MTKKKNITDDERGHFRSAMKNVKPIKREPTTPSDTSKPKHPLKHQQKDVHREASSIAYSHPHDDYYDESNWIGAEDCIHFRHSGLQHKTWQQLRRGQVNIEARLDLHRLTADEATQATDRFIGRAIEEGIRIALIIHGKGQYASGDKPVLKNILNQWLREHKKVIAFHSAQPKHGGTGAMYVLLRKQ